MNRSAAFSLAKSVARAPAAQLGRRSLHASSVRQAIQMPYLSPLMTEGKITTWKKKEGDAFFAGDVLLSIESDFASVDVEAVNSGFLGKILMPDGTSGVKVEQVIALVARDAKELSTMRAAAPSTKPAVTLTHKMTAPPPPPPLQPVHHSTPPRSSISRASSPVSTHLEPSKQPLFASVHRTPSMYDLQKHTAETDGGHAGVHTSAAQADETAATGRSDGDGDVVRRMIVNNLTQKPAGVRPPSASAAKKSKCATSAYFDGLL